MTEQVTIREWVEGIHKDLSEYLTASDPVGDEETGFLVQLGYGDLTIQDVADKLNDRLPEDRDYLCYLLAATLLTYTIDRTILERKQALD